MSVQASALTERPEGLVRVSRHLARSGHAAQLLVLVLAGLAGAVDVVESPA